MKYYLAYGSNLNREQMAHRCPGAIPVGTGYIEGYRLMYKGSSSGAYLTIEKAKGHRVPVGVWCVDEADEKALDRYEGCPTFYYKKSMTITVKMDYGARIELECFVYIMHEDRRFEPPQRSYVETCEKGYKDFGFDMRYLDEAFGYTVRNLPSYRGGTVWVHR